MLFPPPIAASLDAHPVNNNPTIKIKVLKELTINLNKYIIKDSQSQWNSLQDKKVKE
jgi:hypothetical protein